jgi:AcrR family transcriptional regulator
VDRRCLLSNGKLNLLMPSQREPIELPVLEAVRAPRADAARNAARILDACERLFSERGVENVSMDEIAAEAGVGKGTLFRRFGDRAGLARAVIGERTRRFQEELIRGEPPLGPGAAARERLVAFVAGLAELLELHGELMRTAEASAPDEDAVYRFHRTHVELLVHEADPEADAGFTADALLAMLTARAFLYMRIARELPLERIIEGWTEVVHRLLPGPES